MQVWEIFAELLRFNAAYLTKTLKEIEPASFFIRPEGRGNPLIWILGHVVLNRCEIVEILGGDPKAASLGDLFARGTQPENDPNVYPSPSWLLGKLAKLSSMTDYFLSSCDQSSLDQPSNGQFKSVGHNLAYSYMHETHHIGQISYIVNLPGIKKIGRTTFTVPERKSSTTKIILDGIMSVFK